MTVVRESLITEGSKNRLELTAGLAVIQEGSILLVHPKGTKWYGTYSIPKGHVEEGESLLEAAIRETREETGITIDKNDLIDPEPKFVDYEDKHGNLYKRVYYYVVNPKIPIIKEAIKSDDNEVDWSGFVLAEKAEARIFWRMKSILENIDFVDEIEKAKKEKKKPDEKPQGTPENEINL